MSKLKIGVKKIEHMAIFHSKEKENIHLLIYHFCNTIDELNLKESKREYIKDSFLSNIELNPTTFPMSFPNNKDCDDFITMLSSWQDIKLKAIKLNEILK